MRAIISHFIIQWIKTQFHGNPLVEETGEYLTKVAAAFQVGFLIVLSVIGFAFVGYVVFVVGVLKGWF